MTKAELSKEVKRLASLAWTTELKRYEDGTVFAKVVELPGCMTEADSEEEAVRSLREALELWLESELEHGRTIPKPEARRYSGTFTVRTSPWLHRLAADAARRQNVSLNEFVNEVVALASGGSAAFKVTESPGLEVRFHEWIRKTPDQVLIPYPRLCIWLGDQRLRYVHALMERSEADRASHELGLRDSAAGRIELASGLARFAARALAEWAPPEAGSPGAKWKIGVGRIPNLKKALRFEDLLDFLKVPANRLEPEADETLWSFPSPQPAARVAG